ncbi:hypothetical protein CC85DRAFT_302072 [Cutaneotrichosporon oleaginosum]|uniref:Coilin n=1 Tax=Cutaneotrichosporon oleaginosum TaxID=879819 RepID=A0A0J0XNT9_9TREE|nr:uncharacterized protein CC85DRAFT_302072 [Cutaneotrichosporon oleaginosum]KLT42748.1 hypothetical protein CC85DRAFT_302072 [Cutaneotrichosporon oleaginosum]TXT09533.1 hypothetical protein COLE_03467 [Cutaneotrichosporon oleaginosum]
MRVKLHILPPLPERKVVLPLQPGVTIGAFAEGVALALIGGAVRGTDLLLEIDGFELLPDTAADILNPDDIVTVRLGAGAKRKRSAKRDSPRKRKADGDSSSTSATAVSISHTFPTALRPIPTAPPGQGSGKTHNRNVRRRIKRDRERAAAAAAALSAPSSPAGALPIETGANAAAAVQVTTTRVDPAFVPRDIANPNKKRGFRDAMLGVAATRVVYEDDASSASPAAGAGARAGAGGAGAGPGEVAASKRETGPTSEAQAPATPSPPATPIRVTMPTQRRFVPPSEMDALPSNVFVTSREFAFKKDDDRRRADARAAKTAAVAKAQRAQVQALAEAEAKARRSLRHQATRASPVYAQEDEEEREWTAEEAAAAALFARAERTFDALPPALRLRVGDVAAYKATELNMVTYSPELRVVLARVVRVDDGSVSVRTIPRPEGVGAEEVESDVPLAITKEWRLLEN